MVAIISVIAAAFALSMIFNRKVYETLPVAVFVLTLALYAFALILPLNISVYICAGLVIAGFAFSVLKQRSDLRKEMLDLSKAVRVFFVPVIICLILCILFSNHRVFFYDDLSYWALYTRNIFAIDKLPHLFENCSVDYKDYTPIIQILQYLAMFGKASFSEAAMFRTNVCLIYILLLPMLFACINTGRGYIKTPDEDREEGSLQRKVNPVNTAGVIMYVIFPHILTAQFYYRLGVDLILALVFGYVLYYIFIDGGKDAFTMAALATGLSFLALVKTSGIVLCLLAAVMFAIRQAVSGGDGSRSGSVLKRGKALAVLRCILLFAFSLGSYMSWQLFLHYSWNKGYLSDRIKAGAFGGGFSLPEYTKEVVLNYIKHFFTYPLTRNRIGVTAALLVIFISAVYVAYLRSCSKGSSCADLSSAGSSSADLSQKKDAKCMFAILMAGFAVFMVAHLCMYLFVFDEWEAHGLMEFDRYICQYLGGAFYVYVCLLIRMARQDMTDPVMKMPKELTGPEPVKKSRAGRILLYVSAAVFILLLPYDDISRYLIPQNYDEMYENECRMPADKASSEWERSGIGGMDLAHDGSQKLTVVANAWDETTQFLEYTAVPQPFNRIVNVPAVEPGRICGYIMDFVDEYVYICENAPASYTGSWDETRAITSDKQPLRPGALYITEKKGEVKYLRMQ